VKSTSTLSVRVEGARHLRICNRVEDAGWAFDLVEEHDEKVAPHGLGELAAFVVPTELGGDPTRRDTGCFSMYSDMSSAPSRFSSPNRKLGSGLRGRSFRLDGTRNEERPRRTLRVLETDASPDRLRHRVGSRPPGRRPVVQPPFPCAELSRSLLRGACRRGCRSRARDFGDRLFGSPSESRPTLAVLCHSYSLALRLTRVLLLVRAGFAARLELLCLDRAFLLARTLASFFEIAVVGRCLHAPEAQSANGLVDEVDRLVGEVAVGDV